jgi:hypothetical protein
MEFLDQLNDGPMPQFIIDSRVLSLNFCKSQLILQQSGMVHSVFSSNSPTEASRNNPYKRRYLRVDMTCEILTADEHLDCGHLGYGIV